MQCYGRLTAEYIAVSDIIACRLLRPIHVIHAQKLTAEIDTRHATEFSRTSLWLWLYTPLLER